MGGDEVDRGVGTPAALIEMIARGGEPAGQVGNPALLTHPEGPRGIPKTVVPFRPARRKTAHLVAPGTAVPGLGNELALAEYRVLAAGHQKRSEEHTSELQSRPHLVCRLLLEKKKKKTHT